MGPVPQGFSLRLRFIFDRVRLCATVSYMYDAISLHADDRRLAPRFPLRTYMNQYVRDVPYQAVALDVSESGLAIRKPTARVPHTRFVGLELELPGTSEIIWASAEPRFHSVGPRTHFSGLDR